METSSPTETNPELGFNMDDEKMQLQEHRVSATAGVIAESGDRQAAAGFCYWWEKRNDYIFALISTIMIVYALHFQWQGPQPECN